MSSTDSTVDWFDLVCHALRDADMGEPSLVIDLDRLDHNIEELKRVIPAGRHVRLVQKSLPSSALLKYVNARLGGDRLMVFHAHWLSAYAQRVKLDPWKHIMLGKPMPVAAARMFYNDHRSGGQVDFQPHWLIDTLARMQQYLLLARELGNTLNVCIEIDVGLHRGGVSTSEAMADVLDLIQQHPTHLRLTGFMGYDAHVAKAPRWVRQEDEMLRVCQRYDSFVAQLKKDYPSLWHEGLVFNGAGSPTVMLHHAASPLNDVAVGSALLKPTDFDLLSLLRFLPAVLLAVPVLKVNEGINLPFLPAAVRWLMQQWYGEQQTVCLYGGRFWAEPVWPPDIKPMPFVGYSSNQQMMRLPEAVPIRVDDWTLWRPTQSERVLCQYGDLLGLRGHEIVERFPVDT